MELKKINVIQIGALACIGALISILADLFSGWSNTPNSMNTAISLDIESIKGLFLEKPRWTFVLGNYLGVFFIPFHMLGFWLVYQTILPAGKIKALIFLVGSFYFVAVGAGYHGTFAFIGDTIQSNNIDLLTKMLSYWSFWGITLVVGYILLCIYLGMIILSGKTYYPRWTAALTPIPLMILSASIITIMPDEYYGTKAFFAVTGLNLPLLIFYFVTIKTLLSKIEASNNLI